MNKIILIGNHIGNHLDLSLRAIEALKTADIIIHEYRDPFVELINSLGISVTQNLFCILDIEENDLSKKSIADAIRSGQKVVMLSDAGYPMIADNGLDLITFLIDDGLDVEVIGGPSISSTAHVVAGLKGTSGDFLFQEFFKFETEDLPQIIKILEPLPHSIVIADWPHRFHESVRLLKENLGNRNAAFCIEITTDKSKIIRGSLESIEHYIKTEYNLKEISTLVVSGKRDARLFPTYNYASIS
jgi:16S rRNA (cytidine1402-2'-O)-methyltransferase